MRVSLENKCLKRKLQLLSLTKKDFQNEPLNQRGYREVIRYEYFVVIIPVLIEQLNLEEKNISF